MNDTPRTDEVVYSKPHKGRMGVDMSIALATFSRKLERENESLRAQLTEANRRVEELEKALSDIAKGRLGIDKVDLIMFGNYCINTAQQALNSTNPEPDHD